MHPKVICDWGFVLTFFCDSLRRNQFPDHLASWQMKQKQGSSTLNLNQHVWPLLCVVSWEAASSQPGHQLSSLYLSWSLRSPG